MQFDKNEPIQCEKISHKTVQQQTKRPTMTLVVQTMQIFCGSTYHDLGHSEEHWEERGKSVVAVLDVRLAL